LRVYRRIVERVHAGEDYYDAAGSELRTGGYATRSLFNWRLPLYAWLLGNLPTPGWGQVLLVLISLTTVLLAFATMRREGVTWAALVGAVLVFGAVQWCVDGDAFFAQEVWAGTLIGLSSCAYGLGRWPLGASTGLWALFFRELALPYLLISLALAWWHKRWTEVMLLLGGLFLYALFLTFHATQVAGHATPADRAPDSWIQFGGVAFILQTCHMNKFLFAAPSWLIAFYLVLSLLGLAGTRGEIGIRLSLACASYVAVFSVVGQPFNDYWGLLYAALLPFGLVRAPTAVTDLVRSLGRRASRTAPLCELA
jgi:hypothetical protein